VFMGEAKSQMDWGTIRNLHAMTRARRHAR